MHKCISVSSIGLHHINEVFSIQHIAVSTGLIVSLENKQLVKDWVQKKVYIYSTIQNNVILSALPKT